MVIILSPKESLPFEPVSVTNKFFVIEEVAEGGYIVHDLTSGHKASKKTVGQAISLLKKYIGRGNGQP